MAISTEQIPLTGLARKLVIDGLISEEHAVRAFAEATQAKISFVSYIVRKGLADAAEVANTAAHEFGMPLLDISTVEIEREVVKLVSEKLIRQHHVFPLCHRGNRLFVALSDPSNHQVLDEVKFHTGLSIEGILVEENKLTQVMEKGLEEADTTMAELVPGDDLENLDNLDVGADDQPARDEPSEIDDAPVVRFVNKILLDAIKKGASDIHMEPYEKFCRVRFRMDGVLREMAKPPLPLAGKITARIKVMSRLDVSERRVPQDGRIKLKLSKTKAIDFRVSTCPTLFGEKTVLRILDPSSASLGIDALGYEDFQRKIFLDNLHKPYGMFLVTGPTGSGKTVSLYTGIHILNKEDVNISTVEDPVEINLPGVNQVQVDERTGMTFEKALKAFLRQDPDIILVGEIRDFGTGGIAIKAAQTGHMVMATLHTNDAPQTLTRMIDMGIPPFAIATAVNVISAQRLARRLCQHCKQETEIPREALLAEGFTEEETQSGFTIFEPVGCDRCNDGYKGRVGIYQVMPVSEEMKRMIMEGRNAIDLADQAAKEGIPDLRRSGLKKVKDGVTSLKEVNRVTLE
ncbi:MAG: type IV-A pilus assembly ATPase PilB [Gammaproteobacteria bacterium]|jgi:type IV pilus assembly protein PilB